MPRSITTGADSSATLPYQARAPSLRLVSRSHGSTVSSLTCFTLTNASFEWENFYEIHLGCNRDGVFAYFRQRNGTTIICAERLGIRQSGSRHNHGTRMFKD